MGHAVGQPHCHRSCCGSRYGAAPGMEVPWVGPRFKLWGRPWVTLWVGCRAVRHAVGHATGDTVGRAVGDTVGHATGQPPPCGWHCGSCCGSGGDAVGHATGDAVGRTVGQATADPVGRAVGQAAGVTVGRAVGQPQARGRCRRVMLRAAPWVVPWVAAAAAPAAILAAGRGGPDAKWLLGAAGGAGARTRRGAGTLWGRDPQPHGTGGTLPCPVAWGCPAPRHRDTPPHTQPHGMGQPDPQRGGHRVVGGGGCQWTCGAGGAQSMGLGDPTLWGWGGGTCGAEGA